MPTYGITFDVTGKTVQEMAKIEQAMQKLGATAVKETDRVEHSVDSMTHSFDRFQERLVEVFALEKIREFGTEILHVTAEFEGFDNRVRFASLNSIDASTNIAFLRKEIGELHLPMRQVYEGFSEMEAGLVGTGIEGKRLRNLFEGISTAAATLHLPNYAIQRTLYDLKEIGEIGLNMRLERSLATALPGINGIVKKAFGKTMHELQLEGMSGPAFLDKLGPALTKNFAGGLQAYGESLQAKLADTQNRFTQMQIDMGEKLKPVYISLMNTLIGVMDKIGSFVSWLNDHSEALSKFLRVVEMLGIAWIVYKSGIQAVILLEKAYTVATAAMTVVQYTAAYGVQGLSFALKELNISISSIGWGVMAAGIAFVIKAWYDWNAEIDKTVEKFSNLKKIGSSFEQSNDRFTELMNKYKAFQQDPKSFTESERTSLAQGLSELYKQQHEQLVGVIKPNMQNVADTLGRMPAPVEHEGGMRAHALDAIVNEPRVRMQAAADSLDKINDVVQTQMAVLQKALGTKEMRDALKQGEKLTYDPTAETAGKSGHLSGAEGGLGQAKIINIRIDTVQKNYGVHGTDLVRHAEEAADMIIRAANNFSESQQGTY